ncbi:hypothetical protein IOD14_20525 [Streptomyces sp. A2-16]|uniref:hypothetical protein n=1 Tax=Streptomyces sp. A2-16 TaxID=2781734 RepID=UPI001BB0965C|nr:hypothetical protein [Streptomyces sp. A2-16]QUC58980.1 hypothetical protein IOD14_20525 [Streptomyces sp. A2-16]
MAENKVRPEWSLAVMSPALSLARVTPVALVDRLRLARAGFAAAVAFLTIRTSLNPPVSCAVTARSTSGSTSGYVAVAPERVGVRRANAAGSDTAREPLPARMLASGSPVPPPERDSVPVVTFGEMVPSAWRTRVGSRLFHCPCTNRRTGATVCLSVSVPFGLAVSVEESVVAAVAWTGLPVERALAMAWSSVSQVDDLATACGVTARAD